MRCAMKDAVKKGMLMMRQKTKLSYEQKSVGGGYLIRVAIATPDQRFPLV